ncbi:hypothetical protein [Bradyrhizobium canariense]|uniref:hypothetical protein n=1 Tax=Bradyrhizobium canariense TaxID=255045 RepID=UPI001B8A1FFA|nr:hypothetical protein [Bradyrhizobium canariense]MBR0954133.1 hypothetical protein [Bradyrhizobium canariense]
MNSLTKKKTSHLFFASTILATMASVSLANADACDDALAMHRKIVSAQTIEYEKEAVAKNKLNAVERAKADCEMVKNEAERRKIWVALVKEDERVCSNKRLKKALNCDSACAKSSLDNAITATKTACDQYEKEKSEEEARAARK